MSAQGASRPDAAPPAAGRQLSGRRHALLPRIALVLTLALLPLGIIAVSQTQRAIISARDTYRANLSAQTSRLAAPERDAIQAAQGITQGLADALAVLGPSESICSDLMRYSAQRDDSIVFLGFIDANRKSECNNRSGSIDFSDIQMLDRAMQRHELTVSYTPSGHASGQPVLFVIQPVFGVQGVFRGVVTLTILTEKLTSERVGDPTARRAVIVTFNDNGDVLTADGGTQDQGYEAFLPADTQLADLVGHGSQLFTEASRSGNLRDFAVVPILQGKVYALGSWERLRPQLRDQVFSVFTLIFPLLMWLISLVVALVVIRLQVILPIRILGRQMRAFAVDRQVFHSEMLNSAPNELREIGETFATMAQKVILDEADLENTVHERDVLIKEVHHRVKNNLQLMSSILNMQVRGAHSDATRSALRKVQDRLASLAAVHRGLYETPQVSQVRVDLLLDTLLHQLATLGEGEAAPLDVEFEFKPVVLVPDQAGPLAMLASEAFTNALKYASAGTDGHRRIRVRLHADPAAPDRILFEIANTVSNEVRAESEQGLGLKLIQAFCAQLDCRMDSREAEAGWYELRISFTAQKFEAMSHPPPL